MTHGTHDFVDDPRNRDILIYVNGELKPRAEAVVSVFDAGFVLGDGVWEGLRVLGGQPLFLDAHLERLYEGAKAITLDIGRDRRELTRAITDTLAANGMTDGFLMDPDADGYIETVMVDTDGNGLPETAILDIDADGTFDVTMTIDESVFDTDFDSSFDNYDDSSFDSGDSCGFEF